MLLKDSHRPKSAKKSKKPDVPNANPTDKRYSVHKQNLCLVSFPVVFVFNLLRSLMYNLFLLIKYTCYYCARIKILQRLVRYRTLPNVDEIRVIDIDTVPSTVTPATAEMAKVTQRHTSPGPADPLLARQKGHHRKAFEYISKALKIDEENEGECEVKRG